MKYFLNTKNHLKRYLSPETSNNNFLHSFNHSTRLIKEEYESKECNVY